MAETPRYLSQPFYNAPILQDGVAVGFVVGVTLTHDGQTVTEQAEAICGPEQAAALLTGSDEAFATWSHSMLMQHNLVARANAAMEARLAETASELPLPAES
jgi:hypothetical protein